jgi:hypothetical protein
MSETSETFETSEMKKCKVSHLLDEAIEGVGVGKELHDVTFLILDDAGECLGQIPAHKFVLSLDSVIFRWGFAHPGSLYVWALVSPTGCRPFPPPLPLHVRARDIAKPYQI